MFKVLQKVFGIKDNTPGGTTETDKGYAMDNEIDTKQAAERLGLTEIYVRRMIRAGRINARKLRRDWLVDVKSLEEFMASGRKWVVKKHRKRQLKTLDK